DIRAMPKITDMSDEEKRIADTALFMKDGLEILTNEILFKSRIIKTNILVDTGTKDGHSTINFPAPLLRAKYLQNRFGSVTRSKSPPNSFKDFIISVFTKMNSKVLQKSLSVGNDCRLLERVWQMEFYHASMQVLPVNIYASVDVGAVFGSEGYLDFYLNDQRNWAIELLRDGDKLQEHQQRFQKDSQYTSILKYAKEWAIIDIRNSKKIPPEQKGKDVIYVLCAENFESVQLMYPDGSNDRVQLLGEEENLLGDVEMSSNNDSTTPRSNDNNTSQTSDISFNASRTVVHTPSNSRSSQGHLISIVNGILETDVANNPTYNTLRDDEYYTDRDDFWTPFSKESIERRIENDEHPDMNPGQA
ncbi:6915_t:CDS:2, partial [Acaulospora morrowiae]